MKNMELMLSVAGVGAARGDLRGIATDLNRAAKAQERLNRATAAAGTATGGAAPGGARSAAVSSAATGGPVGGGNRGNRGGGHLPTVRASGPYGALERARLALQTAQTPTERADAEYAYRRAQDRIDRLNRSKGGLLSRLGSVAATSRYNLGGVSPLVGRTMAAIGVGSEAIGALSLTAAGAAAAGVALKTLAESAAEGGRALKEIRDLSTVSGGTLRQSSRVRAFGISAGEAAALRERLVNDPDAQIAGASIGVRATSAAFGTTNNARLVLETLDGLRKIESAEERLRRAQLLGVESWLPLLNVSDRARASLLRTADSLGELEASVDRALGADFEAATKRWELAGERLKGALFNAFGGGMTDLTNRAADTVEATSKWDPLAQGKKNWAALGYFLQHPSWENFERFGTGKGAANQTTADPRTRAIEANTRALERQTELIRGELRGGGSRAGNAVPAMLNGQALQHAAQQRTLRWGYF